ncbi:MAG: sulfatase-like hydrolase/transferase, partial [Candidatus Aminicenantes bacterium]|nr:sulfatase-like hydrolase/transferase [Candidatus Aminicenantes bacterium]
ITAGCIQHLRFSTRISKQRDLFQKTMGRNLFPFLLMLSVIYPCAPKSRAAEKIRPDKNLNVLLVTLDTTRADRIGCYGYEQAETPNLDRLASEGVRFADAYCQVPLTLPSHSSILTGTYPIYHRVHNNGLYYLSPEFTSLAEVLKEKGFATAAFVSSFTVDSRFGVDQGFDVYDDDFLEGKGIKDFASERRAEKVFDSFSEWIDKNHDKKFFSWVHFYDPHMPYDPPSPFKEKFTKRLYDGEIAYMDYYIGRLRDLMQEKNILDKTLIVLAGDHGEALGEKSEVEHGLYIYDVTLRVPLIFFAPGHLPGGLVLDAKVRLIDIMPTICDMLKISIHEDVQGTTLLPYMRGSKKNDLASYIETYLPREFYGWSELVGLIDEEWKYIKAPRPELYNLKDDPREEHNLYTEQGGIVSKLEKKLANLIQTGSSMGNAQKRKLTKEEVERLRSLGYLAGEFEGDDSKKDLPDPKDKIDEYILFAQARRHTYEKNYEQAEKNYQELLRLNAGAAWGYVYSALLYQKMGRPDDALQILEKGRERLPDSVVILTRLSKIYLGNMKAEQAYQACQIVLRKDPRNFDALYTSGIALFNMNRWQEASDCFAKALAIEPETRDIGLRYAYCLAALARREEALDVYLQLKEKFPDDPIIFREIGILYDSLGNMEKALENLKRTVEIDPVPDAYFNYAVALEKSGRLKDAVRHLKYYLETTQEGNTERKLQAQRALAQWEARLLREQDH